MPEFFPVSSRPLVIIDDDPDAHFLLKRALLRAKVPYPLKSFWSGTDAIDYFTACQRTDDVWPVVVFLDIKLPGLSGFEVLEWLRDHGLLRHMVVAMISTSENPADISRSLALGAQAYLSKNPKPEVLTELLRCHPPQ